MINCERCGALFNEPRRDVNGGGDIGEDTYACPNCGSDWLNEVTLCAECGEIIRDGSGDELCDECLKRHTNFDEVFAFGAENAETVKVNGLLLYIFNEREIGELLLKEVRNILSTKKLFPAFVNSVDEAVSNYVADDPGAFKDYIGGNG